MNEFVPLERDPNYGVSRDGRVISFRKNKILTPKRNWDGYLRVQLWSHCRCEYVSIHRLIAETFVPNPHQYAVVNHRDGNKANNHADNLEWCTQRENVKHAWRTGLAHHKLNRTGKAVRQLTLTGEEVARYPSMMAVERALGIKHTNVSHAAAHHGTAGGFRWEVMPDE